MTTAVTSGPVEHRVLINPHTAHTAGPECACRRLIHDGWTIEGFTVTVRKESVR